MCLAFTLVLAYRRAGVAGVTIVLLAAVLLPGVGTRVNGARAGRGTAGFSFNPRNWRSSP